MLLGTFGSNIAARSSTETRTFTYDISGYPNFESFTVDNFLALPSGCGTYSWGASDESRSGGTVKDPSVSYDANTGILTVKGYFGGVSQRNYGYSRVYVYLYYVD